MNELTVEELEIERQRFAAALGVSPDEVEHIDSVHGTDADGNPQITHRFRFRTSSSLSPAVQAPPPTPKKGKK
ncbi:MAG: hypothetical protein K8U57_01350 [Planctomycetes bacterium]|nr:hypothetical protein [Planctomycetota bacterium]